jgi:DNA-binding beta-propeller fold protein YncE
VKTFAVGRGPSGLVFDNTHGREVAYVVGFGDNNISVIDLVPGSPTEYHMIQRIGFQRTAPR